MKALLIDPILSGITPENYKDCIGTKAIFCTNIKGVKQVAFDQDDIWVVDPSVGVTYEQLQNVQDNAVIFVNNLEGIRIL